MTHAHGCCVSAAARRPRSGPGPCSIMGSSTHWRAAGRCKRGVTRQQSADMGCDRRAARAGRRRGASARTWRAVAHTSMPIASRRFTSGPFLPCSRVTMTERDADARAAAAAARGGRDGSAAARRNAALCGVERQTRDAEASARLRCGAEQPKAAAGCGAAARIALICLLYRRFERLRAALAERGARVNATSDGGNGRRYNGPRRCPVDPCLPRGLDRPSHRACAPSRAMKAPEAGMPCGVRALRRHARRRRSK